jgi:hypothetical protein
VIPLVPVKTDVEWRNCNRQRQHLNWHARRERAGKPAWHHGHKIGIADDHRKYVQSRHTQAHIARDSVPSQKPVDHRMRHSRRIGDGVLAFLKPSSVIPARNVGWPARTMQT